MFKKLLGKLDFKRGLEVGVYAVIVFVLHALIFAGLLDFVHLIHFFVLGFFVGALTDKICKRVG